MSGNFEYFFVSLQQKFETMGKVKMLGALVGDIVGSVHVITMNRKQFQIGRKKRKNQPFSKKISKMADFCFFIADSENNHAEPVAVDSYGLPF